MRNKLFSVCALLFVVFLTFSTSSAQTSLDTTVTARGNMRTGPGTEFDVVTSLTVGTAVRLDGRDASGVWVRGITSGGFVGWMSNGLLGVSLSQISSLPIITADAPILVAAPSAGGTTGQTSTGGGQTSAPVSGGRVLATATALSNVNVRTGPGSSFDRAGGLFYNESFRIDGRNGDQSWVRGAAPDGSVGWVAVQYLDLTTDEVAALPVVDPNWRSGLTTASSATGSSSPAPAATTQSAQPTVVPPAAPIVNSAPVAGFSYGGHIRDLDGDTVSAMNRAGMTWVKVQIQMGGGGSGIISTAHANGYRVLLGVVGDKNQVNNDGYLDSYAQYVAGLAAAGADAIEVWNEPNIDREWITGDINPARYTEMLRRAYIAIKAANPNTLVISGAPAPTGAEGAFPGAVMNDDRFIAGMAAAGAANYMDCIGAHYNEGIVPPNQTSGDPRGDYYTRYLRGMMDVYYNAFGGAKPVCFTELGYLTPEGYGALPGAFGWAANVTISQQAAWLADAISIAGSSGRVRLVIVWNVDFSNYGADPMAGYAMIRADGSCPACDAIGGR